MNKRPAIAILEKYFAGKASEEEKRLVEAWYDSVAEARPDAREDLSKIKQQLYQKISRGLEKPERAPVIPLWSRAAIAAASFLAILFAAWFLWRPAEKPEALGARETPSASPDVMPGGNKAYLQLANGKTILLDSLHSGILAKQGETRVRKTADGSLQYDKAESPDPDQPVLMNTVRIPAGGKYQLVLPDGSEVWLNAASSLRFPVAFNRKERVVELSGEGYFEITKDPSRPFKIRTVDHSGKNMEVRVVGTSFDVNAYEDEPQKTVSVRTGIVSVENNSGSSVLLRPGQQSILRQNQLEWKDGADVAKSIAWKNGLFHFVSEDVASIMRQVARWYDISVEYPNGIPQGRISGKLKQDMKLTQLLKVLELSGIRFRLDGRKLMVFK